jgi:acetyltransferase-like isoleucine patch superfamily enzyme
MATKRVETMSQRAWTLVRDQHGIVSRTQLLDLGLTTMAIRHRIKCGRLHPVKRGVYAVGRPQVTRGGRWMAAVLACGAEAMLSHRSAAALWGFGEEHRGYVEISVRRHSKPRRPGIRTHDRPGLWNRDIGAHLGIPVTTPVRTFLDLATVTGPKTLERAINEADKLDVIDADSLRRALDDHPGQPGIRLLRHVLDKHTFRLSDDELERLFRPAAAAAGLPTPFTKHIVNKFEVDFFWPSLGLVVETDGWRYHRTPSAQTRDALRFQVHVAAGLTPLRFSHYQVKYEPRHVIDILTKTAANVRGQPAPLLAGCGCRVAAPRSRNGRRYDPGPMAGPSLLPSDLAPGLLLGDKVTIGEGASIGGHVVIHSGVRIGAGARVGDHAQIREGAVIGAGSTVGSYTSVDPGVVIGERVSIQTRCYVTGGTRVEDDVFIGPGVTLTNDNTMNRHGPEFEFEGPLLRRACRIGGGATICPGVEIGEEAFVTAGAVVSADVAPRLVVMGVPARAIREVPEADLLHHWR